MNEKKHICDGGDDYGLVDCLQCEKEMLSHLRKSKKICKNCKATISQDENNWEKHCPYCEQDFCSKCVDNHTCLETYGSHLESLD